MITLASSFDLYIFTESTTYTANTFLAFGFYLIIQSVKQARSKHDMQMYGEARASVWYVYTLHTETLRVVVFRRALCINAAQN